jgi:hypothetical protein
MKDQKRYCSHCDSAQKSIIVGAMLLIGGLVGILVRGEITVAILGRARAIREALSGGSSTSTGLTTTTIVSAIAMIYGLIFFALGIVKAKANPNN